MFVVSVVVADGETDVSVDTIAPEVVSTSAPEVTSVEIVATSVAMQQLVGKSGNASRDVVAAGLVGGAVVLSVAWWAAAARGRTKPL